MTQSALATDLYQLTMFAGVRRGNGVDATRDLRAVRPAAAAEPRLSGRGGSRAGARLPRRAALHPRGDRLAAYAAQPRGCRSRRSSTKRSVVSASRATCGPCPRARPFFADEPVLRVTAPLVEAQLVETALLAIVNFQTSIASKAARIVRAAAGRDVMEFGTRRAHGLGGGPVRGARRVPGGLRVDVQRRGRAALRRPAVGHDGALVGDGVRRRNRGLPRATPTCSASAPCSSSTPTTPSTRRRRIVRSGFHPSAVRLDSGDLVALSREVRHILDAGGLTATRILASGDLDEWSHRASLVAQGAPIDGFGVGTSLAHLEGRARARRRLQARRDRARRRRDRR